MKYTIRLYPLVDEGHVDVIVEAESYDDAYHQASEMIRISNGIYENDARVVPDLGIKSLNVSQLAELLDWCDMQIRGSMTVEEAEDGWKTVRDYLRLLSLTGIITNREKWGIHNYVMEWAKEFFSKEEDND